MPVLLPLEEDRREGESMTNKYNRLKEDYPVPGTEMVVTAEMFHDSPDWIFRLIPFHAVAAVRKEYAEREALEREYMASLRAMVSAGGIDAVAQQFLGNPKEN